MNFDNLTISIPVSTGHDSEMPLSEPSSSEKSATDLLLAGFEGTELANLLNRQLPEPLTLAPEVKEHLIQLISREIRLLEEMLAPHEAASKARTAATQAQIIEAMRSLEQNS